MAFNGILIAVIEMVLIYRLEGKRPVMFYITRGILLVGLSFLLLNLSGIGFMLALIMIITVTFGEILSMPFMNSYWITRTQVSNRGQYAALYTMAWSAAQTLGPMGGAQVVQYSNFQVLWYITGGLCFAAAGIFHLLNKKERKKLSGL